MPKSRRSRWCSTVPPVPKPKSRVKVPKPLARTKGVKRKNEPRRSAEFIRCYESEARVAWVKRQPSVVSGDRPCENAHIRTGGTGRKADAEWIVPLTPAEHRHLHAVGAKTFEAETGISLYLAAQHTQREWSRVLSGTSGGQ